MKVDSTIAQHTEITSQEGCVDVGLSEGENLRVQSGLAGNLNKTVDDVSFWTNKLAIGTIYSHVHVYNLTIFGLLVSRDAPLSRRVCLQL